VVLPKVFSFFFDAFRRLGAEQTNSDYTQFRGAALSPATITSETYITLDRGKTVFLRSFISSRVADEPKIPSAFVPSVVELLFDASRERQAARPTAKKLAELVGIERFYALDIVCRFLSEIATLLDRERQIEAGIEQFKWRFSKALDDVAGHDALDGQTYWILAADGNPHLEIDAYPGIAAGCKCVASANLQWMTDE
jgi:hypothetical protein